MPVPWTSTAARTEVRSGSTVTNAVSSGSATSAPVSRRSSTRCEASGGPVAVVGHRRWRRPRRRGRRGAVSSCRAVRRRQWSRTRRARGLGEGGQVAFDHLTQRRGDRPGRLDEQAGGAIVGSLLEHGVQRHRLGRVGSHGIGSTPAGANTEVGVAPLSLGADLVAAGVGQDQSPLPGTSGQPQQQVARRRLRLRRQPVRARGCRRRAGRRCRPRARPAGRDWCAPRGRSWPRRGTIWPRSTVGVLVPPGTDTPRSTGSSSKPPGERTVMSAIAGPAFGLTSSTTESWVASAPTPVNHWSATGGSQSTAASGAVCDRPATSPGARSSEPVTTVGPSPGGAVETRRVRSSSGAADEPSPDLDLAGHLRLRVCAEQGHAEQVGTGAGQGVGADHRRGGQRGLDGGLPVRLVAVGVQEQQCQHRDQRQH